MTTTAAVGWRFRLSVHTRAREIPWDDVLRPGRSILYSWLHKQNPELAAEIHADQGPTPFGYGAPTFPHATRRAGAYTAGGHGWWEFGTLDRRVALAWVAHAATKPLINWGGVAITVTAAHLVRPPHITGDVVWQTATPAVVRGSGPGGHVCLAADDRRYGAALGANLRRRARDLGLAADADTARVVVIHAGARRTYLVSGSDVPRFGHVVKARLVGSAALLRAVWAVGIGAQTGAGFGWIHDPADRDVTCR